MKNDNRFKFMADVHSSGRTEKCSANGNDLVHASSGGEEMTFQHDMTDAQERSKTTTFRRRDSYKIDVNER